MNFPFKPIIDVIRESNKSPHLFEDRCYACDEYKTMHVHWNYYRWRDAGEWCEGYFCDDPECQRRKRLLP